ncbi:lanthionine synthetase C family protein [Paenibacillus zanthoxyli]|uniref:lanthionine synthetase C family protein n=1 Tax=Paenibacillus zanthoxyli TaxID=369399 RepID=UPI0004727D92|nr:lanthionine synthetase C family protein [Paenibacillus zanthoxyli]
MEVQNRNWGGFTTRAEEARKLSLELTNRLKDPERVKQIVTAPDNLSLLGGHPWDDVALSAGYPGTILLFAEWDRQCPDEGWDLIAHSHLLVLQEGLRTGGYYNMSMFCGLAGVAFAVMSASRKGTRYTGFLTELNERITDGVWAALNEIKRTASEKEGVSPMAYDVIMGLTGIGRYLLEVKDHDKAALTLSGILEYLVELTCPIEVDGYTVPGWYVPQKHQFTEESKKEYPHGSFNCGLSHGIPGPLALMSLALQKGVEVEGQRDAIRRASHWLIEHAEIGEHGLYWPSAISFEQETVHEGQSEHSRDAWCYGTAGVARSLFLAGQSLQDDSLCQWGIRGFDAIFSRTEEQWNVDSPTFCHGLSGLLQLTVRMAQDVKEERFYGYIEKPLNSLLQNYDPESPLGYRDLEIMNGIDKAGLLDGTVGIALFFLSLSSTTEPIWDYPFLIA